MQCTQAFISTAERVDVLVDLRHAAVGETVLLHTLAFDAMHAEGAMPAPVDAAAMGHAMQESPAATDLAPGGTWPEGAPRALLELRVRKRVAYDRRIPDRLSTVAGIDTANAPERPFRLGFAKGRWRINDRVFEMGVTPIEVRARDRGDLAAAQLPHEHAARDAPARVRLRSARRAKPVRTPSPRSPSTRRDGLPTDLGRKDTVLVWPGESVRIAIDFTHPFPGPQTYMFHCHNLEHEDAGMMLGVSVT